MSQVPLCVGRGAGGALAAGSQPTQGADTQKWGQSGPLVCSKTEVNSGGQHILIKEARGLPLFKIEIVFI